MKKKKELHQQNYLKNLLLTKNMTRFIVTVVSGVLVIVFVILGVLCLLGVLTGFGGFVDYFVFALLSGTGVYGMYESINVRRISKIDAIFPDFVRDLAESRRAGMTFTKAILFASKGEYGILTPEVKKITQQVSWGGSVTDALQSFAQRVNTKSIRRTITLIIEASNSGGNVADVLDVAAKDAREIKMLEAERRTNMASYVVVIYVGMFVFLAIVLILCTSFIPAMVGGEGSQGMQGVMGGGSMVSQGEISNVFFLACLVQAFGSALVAGVFEDGRFTSSVKHIFIMVFTTWLMFKLLLGV
ncbi:MAG: type II secretion system F family protein [Candidatus Thermoplasmatota archaeon]|nr:type II secretion system F family protein [Candidatus Thermoplasmatota archaeon]